MDLSPYRRLLAGAFGVGMYGCVEVCNAAGIPVDPIYIALAATAAGPAGSIAASAIENILDNQRPKAKEILSNHDLRHLVGRTIAVILESASTAKELERSDSKALLKIGKLAEEHWTLVMESPSWAEKFAEVQESELADALAAARNDVEKQQSLTPELWKELLSAWAEEAGVALSEPGLKYAAERLHNDLLIKIPELLKDDAAGDGKAFAGYQIQVFSHVLNRLDTLQHSITETVSKEDMEKVRGWLEQMYHSLDKHSVERLQTVWDGIATKIDQIVVEWLKPLKTSVDAMDRKVDDANRKLDKLTVQNRLIENLLKQIEQKDARIAELEMMGETPSAPEVVRDAVETILAESHNEDLPSDITPEEVQRRLIAKSDQLEQEAAIKETELIENDRKILHFAQLRGDVAEVERRIDKILARRPNDLDATNRLGHLHLLRGNLEEAEKCYLNLQAHTEPDPILVAISSGNLGLIYRRRGELDRAEEMHQKSLAIHEELGRREGMASDYGNLGLIYQTRGELDRAEEMHQKSLAIEKELGRREGMANQYGNLGLIYQTRGELDRAEEMHQKSLAIHEALGHREGMAADYSNLGLIYQMRGELDRAEEMHQKSLAIHEELGHREGMAIQYFNLGSLCKSQGKIPEARNYWLRSRDLFAEIGMPHKVEKVQTLLDSLEEEESD